MRPLCSPFPSPALPSASSSLPVPLQGSILELKAPESPSPSTPTETRAENAARSRIRWVGTVGSSPHAEWVEDAGDLIPRIHTTLAGILPSISSNMSVATVEFLAEGTWHRTYTVYLSTQASSTIVGETMPIADEPKSLKDPQPPSPPPSPHSSSTLSSDPSSLSRPSSILLSPLSSLIDSPHTPVSHRNKIAQVPVHSLPSQNMPQTELIMRVALPACPTKKTDSEVATLQWVCQHTSIPVPQVYAYSSYSQNGPLGYEWILMERMPGEKYAVVEDSLSHDAQIALATTLAGWVDSLTRIPFAQIGSLYRLSETLAPDFSIDSHATLATIHRQPLHSTSDRLPSHVTVQSVSTCCNAGSPTNDGTPSVLGTPIFQPFFGDWRLEYDFDRGPFATVHDFALACSAAYKAEVFDPRQTQRAEIDHLEWLIEEDDLETTASDPRYSGREQREAQQQIDAETEVERITRYDRLRKQRAALQIARTHHTCSPVSSDHTRYDFDRLEAHRTSTAILDEIIDILKPRSSLSAPTVLTHWDLSKDNILVDAKGQPTALLDWEQIITLPLSVVPYYPRLLQDGLSSEYGSVYSDDCLDESEQSHMRRAFDQRLRELESPWLDILDDEGNLENETREIEAEYGQRDGQPGTEWSAAIQSRRATAPMPSRRLLRLLFSELQHSFHSPKNVEDLLQEVKDEMMNNDS